MQDLFEKLTVVHLFKKFSVFYGSRPFLYPAADEFIPHHIVFKHPVAYFTQYISVYNAT
jgi:hypothetical protein